MSRTLTGKFIATCVDGKKIRIDKEFKCYISPSMYGTILEPNPLKALGLPLPLPFLIVLNKYKYEEEGKKILMPIAEGILLKSGSFRFFEDEVERILKEEEASLIFCKVVQVWTCTQLLLYSCKL